jgi:hypothetical protein
MPLYCTSQLVVFMCCPLTLASPHRTNAGIQKESFHLLQQVAVLFLARIRYCTVLSALHLLLVSSDQSHPVAYPSLNRYLHHHHHHHYQR